MKRYGGKKYYNTNSMRDTDINNLIEVTDVLITRILILYIINIILIVSIVLIVIYK